MLARTTVLLASALILVSCASTPKDQDAAACLAPKPGTIVSVNSYCAIVPADPVDPAVAVEWNSKTVAFCCKGCVPKWEKLTEAQKEAALAVAVAKGPVQN